MSDNYKIKYSSKDQFYVMVVQRLGEWITQLEDIEKKISVISNMESFQGTTAESVKSYLNEVHNILLVSVRQTILDFQYKISFFSNGYYDIEPNIYANISSETLRSLKSKADSEKEYLFGQHSAIQTSINEISDLSLLNNPSQENILGALSDTAGQADTLDKNISEYESAKKEEASGELAELIATLYSAINTYYLMNGQITGYKSGDYSAKTEILNLYNKVSSSMEYTAANQEAVIEANENIQEVFAQQQKDYEEACEARKDEGTANMIVGALAVVGGVAAIVLTAGAATPVVVVAAVSGTCATAYGVSNIAEGAQDYYYGSIGDLSTEAWNPIRDTVFCGNQALYDTWGTLSLTVAGLCVPINSAVNSVAGASGKVIAKEVTKTVVKESVKGFVIGETSEHVTNYVADELNLNKTQTVILNEVVEAGLEKGVDVAEKAYGKHRDGAADGDFTDRMSYDDAKRYNEFMNDPDGYRASLEEIDINKFDDGESSFLPNLDKSTDSDTMSDADFNKDIEMLDAETGPNMLNDPSTYTGKDGKQYPKSPMLDQQYHYNDGLETDAWNTSTLKKGDKIYQISREGGTDSPYFVSSDTVAQCKNSDGSIDVDKLKSVLQIEDTDGVKTEVREFTVEKKFTVGSGNVSENPQYGIGGGKQFYLDSDAKEYISASKIVKGDSLNSAESTNPSSSIDFSKSANSAEEQAIIADMEKNGEFVYNGKDYGAVEVDPNLAVPKEPGRRLPTDNNGTIIGDRDSGTFEYVPDDAETQKIISKYGEKTVKYNNDEPDFSPYTKHDSQWGKVDCEVEIGHMVGSREGTADNLGNYDQADIALSKKISSETGTNVTPEQVKTFREGSNLTWHETSDGKTMQLVPTEINANCAHKGGVSAKKYEQAWGDMSLNY